MGQDHPESLAMVPAEQVCICSLTLVKTFKHGLARVPMEVMGLTIGEFNDFAIRVTGVLSMPQSGTVSVEKLLI